MGMLGLMRVLLIITVPEANADGSAIWIGLLGVLAAVTMTWGNIAALGSENPKRMLAYSSVAHAGYMLAALTAIGAWNWGLVDDAGDAMDVVVAALIFHMFVLVFFKLERSSCLEFSKWKEEHHVFRRLRDSVSENHSLLLPCSCS